MKKDIDYKILSDFSKGKYSYNDYLQVKEWFAHIEKNESVKQQLLMHWEELSSNRASVKDESLQHIFEKIQHRILLEEKQASKNNFVWNFYRTAAAILLIPVLAFSFWFYTNSTYSKFIAETEQVHPAWVEVNAPEGAKVRFSLPDGSTGWLNSGAKIKYPVLFNGQRKVELTGEAYFEVQHQDSTDFIVSIPDMDIKVLGTTFNVSAYSGDSYSNVVLKEGKVEINGKVGNFNHTLAPGEKIAFNRETKSLLLSNVDANRFMAWKDGYLIIENEYLGQIIGRIERWYNVDIIIEDERLMNYRFKATFKDEPLEEVLRLIAKSTPIKYSFQKREPDSNGVFPRRVVTIQAK
jgi:ferric-dicitrate binding protein FerR (iron transport regulator)